MVIVPCMLCLWYPNFELLCPSVPCSSAVCMVGKHASAVLMVPCCCPLLSQHHRILCMLYPPCCIYGTHTCNTYKFIPMVISSSYAVPIGTHCVKVIHPTVLVPIPVPNKTRTNIVPIVPPIPVFKPGHPMLSPSHQIVLEGLQSVLVCRP